MFDASCSVSSSAGDLPVYLPNRSHGIGIIMALPTPMAPNSHAGDFTSGHGLRPESEAPSKGSRGGTSWFTFLEITASGFFCSPCARLGVGWVVALAASNVV